MTLRKSNSKMTLRKSVSLFFLANSGGVVISILTFFPRLLMIFFHVPNFKIVYKSGHVEYYFLEYIRNNGGKWSWKAYGKTPLLMGVDDFESIHQLY